MANRARVPKTTTPEPKLEVSRLIVQVVCVNEHHAIVPWPVGPQGDHGSFIFEGNAEGDATKHLVEWATKQLPEQLATPADPPVASAELAGKTKAELRGIAKGLGLKVSGNVAELTARIAAHQAAAA